MSDNNNSQQDVSSMMGAEAYHIFKTMFRKWNHIEKTNDLEEKKKND